MRVTSVMDLAFKDKTNAHDYSDCVVQSHPAAGSVGTCQVLVDEPPDCIPKMVRFVTLIHPPLQISRQTKSKIAISSIKVPIAVKMGRDQGTLGSVGNTISGGVSCL